MNLAFRAILMSVLALACFSGCAATELPPKLPPPSSGSAEGSLHLDLPAGFADGKKIPAQAEGKLKFNFESKAIQADPLRSHFDGRITLLITDAQGTRKYVDFAATLAGDYAGTPNEGWARAGVQASDFIELFCKGLGKMQAEPNPH